MRRTYLEGLEQGAPNAPGSENGEDKIRQEKFVQKESLFSNDILVTKWTPVISIVRPRSSSLPHCVCLFASGKTTSHQNRIELLAILGKNLNRTML